MVTQSFKTVFIAIMIGIVFSALPVLAQDDMQVSLGIDGVWTTAIGDTGINISGIGGLYYYDENINQQWDVGEAVWIEVNGDGWYDYGSETCIVGMLEGGELGRQEGLLFNDASPQDTKYSPDEDVWFDTNGDKKYSVSTPFIPDAQTIALWHFDETSGSTAFDGSDNGLNLQATQPTIFNNEGMFRYGLSFGQGEVLSLYDTNSVLGLDASLTIDVWVKGDLYRGTLLRYGFNEGLSYSITCGDGLSFTCSDGPTIVDVESNSIPVDNQWHHLKCIVDFDRDSMFTFVDDALMASKSIQALQPASAPDSLVIGEHGFSGALDELRITRGARYKEPVPLVPPSAPVAFIASSITATSCALSWDANPAADSVVFYQIFRNDSLIDSVVGGHVFNDANLSMGTEYLYGLEAVNKQGEPSVRIDLTIFTLPSGISGKVYDASDSSLISDTLFEIQAINIASEYSSISNSNNIHEGYSVALTESNRYVIKLIFHDRRFIGKTYIDTIDFNIHEHIYNIDFYTLPGDSISGVVRYSGGSGINTLCVMALPAHQQPDWKAIQNKKYPYTRSEDDGSYTLRGLESGAYRVLVSDIDQGFTSEFPADQWFDTKNTFTSATEIVLDNTLKDSINFNLQSGGSVAGTLFSARTGMPIQGVVQVLTLAGEVVQAGHTNDETYTYSLRGILEGPYTLLALPDKKDDHMLATYYGDTTELVHADTFQVKKYDMLNNISVRVMVDDRPPYMVSSAPGRDALVSVMPRIQFLFSEPMDTIQVESLSVLVVSAGGPGGDEDIQPLAGVYTWNSDNTGFSFLPSISLHPATVYVFAVGGADRVGNSLEGKNQIQFITQGSDADTLAPQVIAVLPHHDQAQQIEPFMMAVTFSEMMDPAGFANGITWSGGELHVEYLPEYAAVIVRPAEPPVKGRQDTITVSSALKDAAGNALGSNYTWAYTMETIDTVAPELLYSTPQDSATQIPLHNNINLVFNELVDLTRIDSTKISITSGTTNVSWTIKDQGTDAFIKSSMQCDILMDNAQIHRGDLCILHIEAGAFKDLAGNELAGTEIRFTFATTNAAPVVKIHGVSTDAIVEGDSLDLRITVEYGIFNTNGDMPDSGFITTVSATDITDNKTYASTLESNNHTYFFNQRISLSSITSGYHTVVCSLTDLNERTVTARAKFYVFDKSIKLNYPTTSDTTEVLPTFTWEQATGAQWYILTIQGPDTTGTMQQILAYPQQGETARIALPAGRELALGTYTWSLIAGAELGGHSGMVASNKSSFVVKASPLEIPSKVAQLTAEVYQNAFRVQWQPNEHTENILYYRISRVQDADTIFAVLDSTVDTVFIDTTIQTGIKYQYQVVAVNKTGTGAPATIGPVSIPKLVSMYLTPSDTIILHDTTLAVIATGIYSSGDSLDITSMLVWSVQQGSGTIIAGIYTPSFPDSVVLMAHDTVTNISAHINVRVKQNMPPLISLTTSFANGAVIKSSQVGFYVTVQDTDAGSVLNTVQTAYRLHTIDASYNEGAWTTFVDADTLTMLRDGRYQLWVRAEDARGNSDSVAVRVTVAVETYAVAKEKWQMLSIPHERATRQVTSLFNAYTQVYRWNELQSSGRFILKYEKVTDRLNVGQGCWVRSESTLVFNETETVYYTDTVGITLTKGWNQIGNPYSYPIAWPPDSIELSSSVSMDAQPAVDAKIWRYEGTGYATKNLDVWEPWDGYFVYAHCDCKVVLQKPAPYFGQAYRDSSVMHKEGEPSVVAEDWAVNISAKSSGFTDGYAVLGVCRNATEAQDRYDVREPIKALAGGVAAYLINPTIPYNLAADMRAARGTDVWILAVEAPEGASTELSWNPAAVAEGLVLVDEHRGVVLDMSSTETYKYEAHTSGKDHFTVLRKNSADDKPLLLATDVYLYNTPNPFHVQTAIKYRMPAEVVGETALLKVFNADGVVIDQRPLPCSFGTFKTLMWNVPETAGLYLYQITTSSGWQATGRMLRVE